MIPLGYVCDLGSFSTSPETMAARITASAVDFAAVGAKIPAAQKAVSCHPIREAVIYVLAEFVR